MEETANASQKRLTRQRKNRLLECSLPLYALKGSIFTLSMNYRNYLNTPHWQKLKSLAMHAAKGRCESCGTRENLQGHHLQYLGNPNRCTKEDIVIMCEDCHNAVHYCFGKIGQKAKYTREQTIKKAREICAGTEKEIKPKVKETPSAFTLERTPHYAMAIFSRPEGEIIIQCPKRSASVRVISDGPVTVDACDLIDAINEVVRQS